VQCAAGTRVDFSADVNDCTMTSGHSVLIMSLMKFLHCYNYCHFSVNRCFERFSSEICKEILP